MEIIIVFCVLLEVINLVKSGDGFSSSKWKTNAKDFASATRENIRKLYRQRNPLCCSLREHMIRSQEKDLFDALSVCDDNFNDPAVCYRYHENIFHRKIDDAAAFTTCITHTDICSIWHSELEKWLGTKSTSSCLFFTFANDLIKIWTACEFLDPVHNAERDLQNYIDFRNSSCMKLTLERKSRAINNIRMGYENCRHHVTLMLDEPEERKKFGCQNWITFRNAHQRINECYGPILTEFQKSIKDLDAAFQICKN